MTSWSWTNVLFFLRYTFTWPCQQMTSADKCLKQFGPRSGPAFCPDLIRLQTVWHFRGYEKVKLNWCILLSSADNPFQTIWTQIRPNIMSGPDRGQTVWQVEIEPMCFNYTLNFNMMLSSADYPFKQFGPRSGLTFCPDLIGVKILWHFRCCDKLKLNRCISTLR